MDKVKIANRCVLVRVKSSTPGQTKRNRTVEQEARTNHNTGEKAVRASDVLYPNECLKPWTAEINKVKKIVESLSTPFDRGVRVMLIATRFKKQRDFDKAVAAANAVADSIAADFDAHIAYAKRERNGFFNPDQYPADKDEFRGQFKIGLEYIPMADSDHLLLQCAEDELRCIKEEAEEREREIAKEARQETVDEASSYLQRMIDQLRNYDAKKERGEDTKLYGSLVGNIADMAERIGLTNIAQDARLVQLADELHGVASTTDVKVLKENKAARTSAGDKAQRILDRIAKGEL